MNIPDTRLAQQATEMVREVSPEFLVNHCQRTYRFAAAIGEKRGVRFDAELLYLSALLHDLGLVPEDVPARERFEVDGADRAHRFLIDRGMPVERADTVWEAIALHTSVGIATRMGPEVALTFFGAAADVAGFALHELDVAFVARVIDCYPRLGMKEGIKQALVEAIRRNPRAAAFTWMAELGRAHGVPCPSAGELIAASLFAD